MSAAHHSSSFSALLLPLVVGWFDGSHPDRYKVLAHGAGWHWPGDEWHRASVCTSSCLVELALQILIQLHVDVLGLRGTLRDEGRSVQSQPALWGDTCCLPETGDPRGAAHSRVPLGAASLSHPFWLKRSVTLSWPVLPLALLRVALNESASFLV